MRLVALIAFMVAVAGLAIELTKWHTNGLIVVLFVAAIVLSIIGWIPQHARARERERAAEWRRQHGYRGIEDQRAELRRQRREG